MQYSLVRPIIRMGVPLAVIACGGGPSPKGVPVPSSAEFHTDSVAVVSLSIPGTPQANWNTVNQALNDSSYRYADGDFRRGVMRFRSLGEGRLIQVRMSPVGPDSVDVRITGRTYAGRSRTRIPAADSAWPETRSTDPASTNLQAAATRIRAAFIPSSPVAVTNAPTVTRRVAPTLYQSPDSLLRDLTDGRKAFCKANTFMREVLLTVDNVNLNDWCNHAVVRSRALGIQHLRASGSR